jgi:N-acetyltransferase 10
MASTIQGYEGTGRSLSLKLISQIKEEATRNFREINLEQAIRYSDNDPVESWLNKLLCLDCVKESMFLAEYPHVDDCELYLVNKDTLFSYKKTSEAFLNSLMALFVSSHYKNSPNDLQLISDSTTHKVFILTQDLKKKPISGLPEIYCVIQVAEEGGISKEIVDKSKESDYLPAGDLIPWTLSTYYLDSDFPKLKGGRVVRIATHPSAQRMGYGKKALDCLYNYYQGAYFNISKIDNSDNKEEEEKSNKAPLLFNLSEIQAPKNFSYLGTSYGLTSTLYKFWKNSGFTPVYLKTLQNSVTGEHSCIMIKIINNENVKLNINSTSIISDNWLDAFSYDFSRRMLNLLSFDFRKLKVDLASELINEKGSLEVSKDTMSSLKELQMFLTKEDFKRIQKYSQGLLNCNLILDLIPVIAMLFFTRKVNKGLSPEQAMILIGVGLQRKSFEEVEKELDSIKKDKGNKNKTKNLSNFGIDQTSVMGMFKKIVVKFADFAKKIYEVDFNKSEENILQESNTDISLKFKGVDETMKINPKEDLFKQDNKVKDQEKKIKTEYYSNKFSGQKRGRTDV